MALTDDRTGLGILSREEALRRLGGAVVGRLGVVDGRQPVIFPVNFVLDHDRVVFRTAGGLKRDAALRGPVVFEADEFDEITRTGWSVVVMGTVEEITDFEDPKRVAHFRSLIVDPWTGTTKDHLMVLYPSAIQGREVR
jgi:nitroimidazol reductase NimA-like FMN-containing flavoprotein (pyridoxamine 5'-phosphate oxidase superfamily)